MNEETTTMSLPFLIFVIFLILKLTGVISWSWWWVTSPLWLPLAIVIGVVLLGLVVGGIIILCLAILDMF